MQSGAAIMAIAALPLFLLGGCEGGVSPFAPADEGTVAYRPQEAGTVDHALCLLGFSHVPVRNVSPGHQLVEATINGVTGDFVLDTGANLTVVSTAQAAMFHLSADTANLLGSGPARFAGSTGTARQVRVDSFALGPIAIRQQRVLIADIGPLLSSLAQGSGRVVSGVIGQDVLEEHRAIIDVQRPMLYLIKEDRDPAPVSAARCEAVSAVGLRPSHMRSLTPLVG